MSPELIKKHGLLPDEYEVIKRSLRRDSSLTELGVFSALWSECCSYKNTKVLLKQFPKQRDGNTVKYGKVLVKAGDENAGVVDIGEGWAVSFKIESHNHPSVHDPFEGASAGAGGIIRDIFAMGARPVFLTNSLRFGDLSSENSRRHFKEAVGGIAHYGNTVGLPVVGGDVHFDASYEGNPVVNSLCLGVLRHEQICDSKEVASGNVLFYVGAATGRDGLGSASFASKVIDEKSAQKRPPVHKADPVVGRKLIDACLGAAAIEGLVISIQDLGAGGLAAAASEVADHGGLGVELDLDLVPLREAPMNSYEILLSESQERMLLVVQEGREQDFENFFQGKGLCVAKLGFVTSTGLLQATHHGVAVVDLPITTIFGKAPVYFRDSMVPSYFVQTSVWTPESSGIRDLDQAGVQATLPKLLASPTIASKRWLWKQFNVGQHAEMLVGPGSDAAVVKLRLGETERILAISNDCNARYCYLNPRRGALGAMAEALRNLACTGATPLAMTDNLNFGDPHKPEAFYQLKECVRGLSEACRFFDIPVLGGNVSLYNESAQGSIDPTPTVSIVGIIENEKHITKQWVREVGEKLILLGNVPTELGGSQFLGLIHGLKTGDAPVVDLGVEERLIATTRTLIKAGLVSAAHDLSEGGLLVALCEMLFAPEACYGAKLDFSNLGGGRNDASLFGESQGRIILSVKSSNLGRVISESHMQGVCAAVLGEVTAEDLLVLKSRSVNTTWNTTELRKAWETSLETTMDSAGA